MSNRHVNEPKHVAWAQGKFFFCCFFYYWCVQHSFQGWQLNTPPLVNDNNMIYTPLYRGSISKQTRMWTMIQMTDSRNKGRKGRDDSGQKWGSRRVRHVSSPGYVFFFIFFSSTNDYLQIGYIRQWWHTNFNITTLTPSSFPVYHHWHITQSTCLCTHSHWIPHMDRPFHTWTARFTHGLPAYTHGLLSNQMTAKLLFGP